MKALSVLQPWASLLVWGVKANETRSWDTSFRGPLVICASVRWSPEQLALSLSIRPIRAALLARGIYDPRALPRGVAVGMVNCTDCRPTDGLQISDEERQMGDFTTGRFAWSTPALGAFVQPFNVTGRLGLYDVDLPANAELIQLAHLAAHHQP